MSSGAPESSTYINSAVIVLMCCMRNVYSSQHLKLQLLTHLELKLNLGLGGEK